MKKKYIIDLNPDCVEGEYLRIPARIAGEEQWLVTKAALTPYTEPDLEQVRKEAYEDGCKTAKVQCNIQAEKDLREVGERHYQKGLSDAWEAARKIVCFEIDGGYPVTQMLDLFDRDDLTKILSDYTAAEAIEKIRQYEQEQEEFHVGDEVESTFGKGFVVKVEKSHISYVYDDGSWGYNPTAEVAKTGRHFPEIVTVLAKMRENT